MQLECLLSRRMSAVQGCASLSHYAAASSAVCCYQTVAVSDASPAALSLLVHVRTTPCRLGYL